MTSPSSNGSQPETPDREQFAPAQQQLKSKFSMSPDHRRKRSKTRFQDFSALVSQSEQVSDTTLLAAPTKSSFASSWSRSWSGASRKANKAAAATVRNSEESASTVSDTQAVGPPALKHVGSLANIRRLITPKRKNSSDSARDANFVPHIGGRSSSLSSTTASRDYEDSLGIVNELISRPPLRPLVTEGARHKGTSKSLDLMRDIDRPSQHNARVSLNLLAGYTETSPPPDNNKRRREEPSLPAPSVPAPEPSSRLQTLQLLARRPFGALGKKKAASSRSERTSQSTLSSNRSWWQTRPVDHEQNDLPPRHSEDLLTRASTRMSTDVLGPKSKSVDLDRLELQPSKTVPIWPAATAPRHRPMIPSAFVDPEPMIPEMRISGQKHPWMRQLKLQAVASVPEVAVSKRTSRSSKRSSGRSSVKVGTPGRRISPQAEFRRMGHKQRPPSALLGQSLPIPPRSNRSRASTISSVNSVVSSPSGKVIVSRRSYGAGLIRSPRRKTDETCSITTVGTSILYGESTDALPGKFPFPAALVSPDLLSPTFTKLRRSPASKLNSPLRNVSARRHSQKQTPCKPAPLDQQDDAQEWIDEVEEAPTVTSVELAAFTKRFCNSFSPKPRPGFLEMSEATDSLHQLVGSFDESTGSISLYSSPRKTNESTYGRALRKGRDSFAFTPSKQARAGLGVSGGFGTRRICCSIGSIVSTKSTEANSSFEDSEELQNLIESMMAADVSNSSTNSSRTYDQHQGHDHGGGGDLALLSPFGSPMGDIHDESSATSERPPSTTTASPVAEKLPPPRFLLNDRPISPSDFSNDDSHDSFMTDHHAAAADPYSLSPPHLS